MGGKSLGAGRAKGWRRAIAVLTLVTVVSTADASDATPAQEPTLEEQQAGVRQRAGEVALEVDALTAENAEIESALATLQSNVAAQQAQFDSATAAAESAVTALAEAETAVADARGRVDVLNAASDALAVQAFVFPPADNAWDTLSADNLSDASLMQAVLEMQADQDKDVLTMLSQARDDLEVERSNREAASTEAEATRVAAGTQLTELQAALDQQAAFAAEAEAALDHKLSEQASLAAVDADLSRQIEAQIAEQARLAEEARQAAEAAAAAAGQPPADPGGGGVIPGPDGLSSVSCHTGGSITVASSLAPRLQDMLDAAAADGVFLCGGGYRDSAQQIELRKAHCGTSYYAIYQMPASQCHPPTARPGTSMHEQGLAVDFANCSSRSTACYRWLSGHASDYGLYNLPTESWHWSVNGK
ncbi:MAG TPA: D-alanyl-D-alanine carboxypeptidase family protein [Acidimicrobiales bacterium]|jgi:peptidoglycan hydrolase CwlO-like protein